MEPLYQDAPVEDPGPIEAPAPAEAAPPPATRWRLGGGIGFATGKRAFGAGPDLSVRGSVALKPGGRLRVGLGGAWSGTSAPVEVDDPRYTDIDLRARQSILRVAPVFEVRVLPLSEPISPELWLGPTLDVRAAAVTGTLDGEAFAPTWTRTVSPGAQVGAGVSGRIGAVAEVGVAVAVDVVAGDGSLSPGVQALVSPGIYARWTR